VSRSRYPLFIHLSRRPLAGVAVLLVMSCGGGGDVTAPPTDAPVAANTPTAAPTAAPTPQNGVRGCNLPPVSGASGCSREEPRFLVQVDAAVSKLQRTRPDIFEGTYVRSPGQFYLGVIANLEADGFCAAFDGEEIQVKDSQDYSEQYHLMTSGRYVRWGDVTYRATCRPAAFPKAEAPLPPRGDCSLPSSRSIACARETPKYLGHIQAAIDQLRREQPGLFRGDYVLNPDQYYAGLVKILKDGKMKCAIFDGEEIAVKNDNNMSEQYHVMYSWGQIRSDEYSYRASCYPAAY
jgi:hypothetical protein